jgi:hypothetical protein
MSDSTDRLENLIKERGIRIPDFKKKFNVSPQNYVNWKKRGIPHSEILRLSEFFNVDANWLATGVESKSSDVENALKTLENPEHSKLSSVKLGLLYELYNLIKMDVDLADVNMLHRVISNTQSRYNNYVHS